MRFAFFIAGLAGFALVALVGFGAERPPDLVLRDAALACLLCAFVGRWFWQGIETAFARSLELRRAEAEAAEEAAENAAAAAAASPKTSTQSAAATRGPVSAAPITPSPLVKR
jgi:hypothetical protein